MTTWLVVLAVVAFGAACAGWALWWGERARNIDLRSMLAYGTLPERTQPISFLRPKVENTATDAMPEWTEEMVAQGARDLRALAKAQGVELSAEDAERQALAMLQEAHGYGQS